MGEILKMLVSAILGAIVALYLPRLRQFFIGPKLELSFGKEIAGCIALTPIKTIKSKGEDEIATELGKKYWEVTNRGYYIRVKVTNNSYLLAKECRAFLINIERKDDNGQFKQTIYCDSIQLQWSCRSNQGFNGIDLAFGVHQFIDVLSTIGNISKIIYPKIEMMPYRYENLFREIGTFRYTIQVSGNEIKPVSLSFILYWKGQWDDFDVDIDPMSLKENNGWWENFLQKVKERAKS